MSESQKKMMIESQMNLNSVMFEEVKDEKLKELMSDMNKRYRELGFDNK